MNILQRTARALPTPTPSTKNYLKNVDSASEFGKAAVREDVLGWKPEMELLTLAALLLALTSGSSLPSLDLCFLIHKMGEKCPLLLRSF